MQTQNHTNVKTCKQKNIQTHEHAHTQKTNKHTNIQTVINNKTYKYFMTMKTNKNMKRKMRKQTRKFFTQIVNKVKITNVKYKFILTKNR